jgi:hypothetical protein
LVSTAAEEVKRVVDNGNMALKVVSKAFLSNARGPVINIKEDVSLSLITLFQTSGIDCGFDVGIADGSGIAGKVYRNPPFTKYPVPSGITSMLKAWSSSNKYCPDCCSHGSCNVASEGLMTNNWERGGGPPSLTAIHMTPGVSDEQEVTVAPVGAFQMMVG